MRGPGRIGGRLSRRNATFLRNQAIRLRRAGNKNHARRDSGS